MIKILFICHGNICRSTNSYCIYKDSKGNETEFTNDLLIMPRYSKIELNTRISILLNCRVLILMLNIKIYA